MSPAVLCLLIKRGVYNSLFSDLVSFNDGGQALLQPTRDLTEAQLFSGRAVKAEDTLVAIGNYAKEVDRKYGEEIRKRRLVR